MDVKTKVREKGLERVGDKSQQVLKSMLLCCEKSVHMQLGLTACIFQTFGQSDIKFWRWLENRVFFNS